MTMQEQVQLYKNDLGMFEDKDSKIEYILGYAKEADSLDAVFKIDDNVVKGCSSLAWLHKEYIGGKIVLEQKVILFVLLQ